MDDDQPRDVAPDDALLRRVINRADFLEWHADWGRWIPSAGAVKFDPDGMSTFVERFLQERGQDAAAVGTAGGTKAPEPVFAVTADYARSLDFGVAHTRDDRSSIGYAHASSTACCHDTPPCYFSDGPLVIDISNGTLYAYYIVCARRW